MERQVTGAPHFPDGGMRPNERVPTRVDALFRLPRKNMASRNLWTISSMQLEKRRLLGGRIPRFPRLRTVPLAAAVFTVNDLSVTYASWPPGPPRILSLLPPRSLKKGIFVEVWWSVCGVYTVDVEGRAEAGWMGKMVAV